MLDGDDPGRKGRRRGLRFRLPRTDSFVVEVQHGEAAPLAASDRDPVAGDDGNRDGGGGGDWGAGRPRVRVSWTEKERGTGRKGVSGAWCRERHGALLIVQGPRRHGHGRHWSHSGGDDLFATPLPIFFYLQEGPQQTSVI